MSNDSWQADPQGQQPLPPPPPPAPPAPPAAPAPAASRTKLLIGLAIVAVVVVVGAIALTSGGGDDGDSTSGKGREYVDAMIASEASNDSPFTAAETRCMAEGTIDIIGVDALEEAGITPEMIAESDSIVADFEPSQEQSEEIVGLMFNCADLGAALVDEMFGEDILTTEQTTCVSDGIQESQAFRTMMAESFLGDDTTSEPDSEMVNEFLAIFIDCDVDLTSLGG